MDDLDIEYYCQDGKYSVILPYSIVVSDVDYKLDVTCANGCSYTVADRRRLLGSIMHYPPTIYDTSYAYGLKKI